MRLLLTPRRVAGTRPSRTRRNRPQSSVLTPAEEDRSTRSILAAAIPPRQQGVSPNRRIVRYVTAPGCRPIDRLRTIGGFPEE
jgi:hypothetical protein